MRMVFEGHTDEKGNTVKLVHVGGLGCFDLVAAAMVADVEEQMAEQLEAKLGAATVTVTVDSEHLYPKPRIAPDLIYVLDVT